MSRINFKSGFTLMEIIIVVAILGVLSVIMSGILISSLSGTNKAEVVKEIRQNGNYALSVMEGMILSSRSVTCADGNTIAVVDINGSTTNFYCDESAGIISSNSASLTGNNVTVYACGFSCNPQPGAPTKVDISFSLRQRSTTNLRSSEKASQDFRSSVVTRNY